MGVIPIIALMCTPLDLNNVNIKTTHGAAVLTHTQNVSDRLITSHFGLQRVIFTDSWGTYRHTCFSLSLLWAKNLKQPTWTKILHVSTQDNIMHIVILMS